MITEVQRQHNAGEGTKSRESVDGILERHSAFPSFRPYMSDEAKAVLWGGKSLQHNQVYTPDELIAGMNDIDRLEQAWRLR